MLRGKHMDAATLVFVAAVITAGAGALAGFGGLQLARQQAAAEKAMRERVEDLVQQTSGGDSYVYLEPLRQPGEVRYFVRQTGRYSTYDVVIRVQDGAGSLLFGPVGIGTVKRGSGFDWTIPLPPDQIGAWPLRLAEPPAADAQPREFRVELAARNGIVIQRLRAWPAEGRWHTDSRQIERAGVGPLPLRDDFREAQVQP